MECICVPSAGFRITVKSMDLVGGMLSALLVIVADVKSIPYLFLPWLLLTVKGMLLNQGPSVLGLGYMLLPKEGFPAVLLFVLWVFLLVEEFLLWYNVLKMCWVCWCNYFNELATCSKLEQNLVSKQEFNQGEDSREH
uniref:Uncharacterized protein n=1 Tax=Timema bartmani TaxID=61472 RepID=A0A7R9F329_9NEOP|nr:unnamed protein product [Timema bartmani]